MSRSSPRTRLSRTLVVAGVVLLLGPATAACGGEPEAGVEAAGVPSAGASVSPGPRELTITESSAHHDAGTFAHASAAITFAAKTVSPTQTELTLSVNGDRFSASKNTEKATSRWSGGGAVLQESDRAALTAFRDALNAAWSQPAIPAHRDLTLRMAALLAEAPLGVPIGDHVAPGSRG